MGAFCKMAVVVGMYDINCQGDIENPSLILFSEGLKKKSSFSQRLLKQKYLPLKKEHPRQQISSVNLNPILRTESSRQNCMWSFLPTMITVAIMLERPTLCFGLGEPS